MKKGIILIISLFCMQFSFAQCELDPKHPWDLIKLNQIISQGGICADAWDCSFPRRLAYLTISAGNLTGNVDLSGCTGLQVLNCANNHITSLNLSGCLLLQSINCSNNWISNINLNGCNSLQSIVCNYNLITNLDVSNKLLLQGVNCSNNLLTNINISGCNQLLSVFCQNNKLTEFNAYSSATLTNVDCSMNKISNLKFNGCTSLKKLNCKQNKLKNSALTSLYGLKLGQGISNYNLDLRQNIGFTSNAIYNLDANLQYLGYNQILYDSVSDQFSTELNWETSGLSHKPIGVATDGSATIKITIDRDEGNSAIDSIRIQLQNDNSTSNEQIGTVGSPSSHYTASDTLFKFTLTGLNQWEFYYTAPDVFTNTTNSNISKRFVKAIATIYYTNNGMDSSYTYEQNIELIRPPVLLIHGLNDNGSTFKEMKNYLVNSGRYTTKQIISVDYSETNTAAFIVNIDKIFINTTVARGNLISIGYNAKKIDIVGHSMGGILSRLYLQSTIYNDDIHKLITLNTPHSGSQGANLITNTWNYIPILRLPIKSFFNKNKLKNFDINGAVNDLQVTSDATMLLLNGMNHLNKKNVPSHTIVTTKFDVSPYLKMNPIITCIYLCAKTHNLVSDLGTFASYLTSSLYNGDNDAVVARNSQIGGISPIAFSSISNEWHCGSPTNNSVKFRIKELLELPSSSNSFSMDGFHPPILNWPNTPAPVINQNKSMLLVNTNDSIRLISPIAGTTVTNGQNINVNITGTSGIKNILLTILESQDSVVLIDTLTSNFNYIYTVPQTACGKIDILAIGLDTLGNIFIDSSFINVQPIATPSSIIIDYPEDSLVLSQGLLGSIYVNCLFSDSIIREITTLPNVVYSLKNNNAAFISQGVFKGVHPGNDTIMVSYSGLTAKMPVHIGNYYSPTDSIKLYDTICQGNTYNFYGNILNNTGIYDTTFVNQYGGDSIIILNLTVNPLPATAGTISGLSTVCQGQSSVTYKVLTIANATSYTWTLPTGANGISSTDTIVINYGTSAVSGNIIVRGNNSCGIGDSSLLSITVNPLPLAAGTISGLTTVCQGQTSVVYKVPAIAKATSYTWTLPSGATGTSSVDSIVVSYGSSAISGNITVKGHNTCGSGTVSTKAITVNLLPATAGIISGLATVCQGQSSVVYKVPTISNATSYIWTLPSGATGTSNVDSIVVSYGASATSGNITVKGNNTCGSGTVSTKAITVNPLPANTGTITGLATVCQGQSNVVYKVPTINNATSYTWTLPSGASGTSTIDSVVVSFGTSAVSGNITVKGNNTCGSGTVSTKAITVNPLPATAGIISGLATVCQGLSSVVYKVPTISNATSYTWTLPSGATGTSSVDSIVVNYGTSAVSGNITVKGNNACGSGTVSTKAIIVNPLPTNTGTITGLATVCQGQSSVVYKVPTISNATSYIWTLPSGATGTSNVDSIVVSYGASATSGNITVKGNNTCGSGTVSTKAITVNPLPATAGIISGLATVCQGLSSVVYKVPTISNATSYTWTLPSGATGTNSVDSIVVSFGTSAVSGNITVKGNNSCGSGTVSTKAIIVNPLPANTGTITGLATVCQGQSSVTYKVSTIANATSYTWTLPSGATGTSSVDSIVVNYGTSAVSGNITVKGNNACGSGTVSTKAIIVNPLPANTGTITGLATVCQGQSNVIYKVPTIANATSYTWTFPNGVTGNSIADSIQLNFGNTAVSGQISVKGVNACGNGDSSTLAITVNPLPDAAQQITGLSSVCQGQNSILYKIPSIANATFYTWTLPSGATGTSSVDSIVVNYGTSAVSGNITVKGNNSCGSGAVSLKAITVNPLPVSAGTISGLATVCQGQNNVVYKVPTIANATSYTWTLPSGATGTSNVDSIIVNFGTSATSGNITVKGNNACGNGDSSILANTVNPLPDAAQQITGLTTVCQGQSSITYKVPSIANASFYSWTLPNGTTVTNSNDSIIVNFGTSATSGILKVKGNNACGNGDSSTLAITVNPLPQSPVITQNGDSLFSNAINGNQWYSLTNGIINNATSAFYLPQQIGDYFTIVTLNGCSSDTSNILHFDNTGINNLFGSDCKILVSPNPFSINTTISYTLTESKYIRLSISDITGREIEVLHEGYQAKGEYKYVFTPKSTANGIYFYKLQIDNKYVSGKLIYAK